jgi:hypothetical protein
MGKPISFEQRQAWAEKISMPKRKRTLNSTMVQRILYCSPSFSLLEETAFFKGY